MSAIEKISGCAVYVSGNDIDTDRIIPARFLKCVTFDELGPALFYDVRFDQAGNSKSHVLDQPQHQGAAILISDDNFGCGSSREHAPQAIQKFGFKAIIAGSFAEIFHGNCTTLGIPCVVMSAEDRQQLANLIEAEPEIDLLLDLASKQVIAANRIFDFDMKESARQAFLSASYDPLDDLLSAKTEIESVAKKLGYA